MHRKFDIRRYLTAFFVGIFAIVGTVVAIDAPARAANTDLGYDSAVDYAAAFSGNDYFEHNAIGVIPGQQDFTTEVWINETSGTTGIRDIFGQGTTNAAFNRFSIRLSGDSASRQLTIFDNKPDGNHSTSIADVFVPQGSWNHIAVSHDYGVDYKVYLNGSLIKTIANATNPELGGHFVVGRNYFQDGEYFIGLIDEVKIWNTIRDADQIKVDMHTYGDVADPNLRTYFDFNEGALSAGNDIFNRKSDSYDLTDNGTSPTFERVEKTTKVNGKTVVTFPRSYLTPAGGWTVPSGVLRANVLAVAGGGGGGRRHAGGGGAGELKYFENFELVAGTTMAIGVGQGGLGQPSNVGNSPLNGFKGQSTIFGLNSLNGGGPGGVSPESGGSGGGSTATNPAGTSVKTASGLGNNGAIGSGGNPYTGGGGGGAMGAGSIGNSSLTGAGGAGYVSNITGNNQCYAAGGSGGATSSSISVGAGGPCTSGQISATVATTAGLGSNTDAAAGSAAANSGSGGGGGGLATNEGASGAGGSGIVVIAYAHVDDNYMNFNGTSQYAVASGAQVVPATGAFTLEAWVNATSSGAPAQAMIASQGSGSNRFYVKRNQDKLVTYRDQQTQTTEVFCASLPADQWVHIAVSFTGTNIYCFVNGSLVDAPAFAWGNRTVGNGFHVGQYSHAPTTDSTFWKGGIDQVKIWNTAITDPSIISRSMHAYADQDASGYIAGSSASPALTNLYPFNEATGTSTVTDLAGNTNLVTTGSPTSSSIVSTTPNSGSPIYNFPRTFLSAFGGWFPPVATSTASVLVVGAGGGGGGWAWGGGGGAGAMLSASANQILSVNTPTAIIVGVGGAGGLQVNGDTNKGSNGGDSAFGSAIAKGGGGGAGWGYFAPTSARSSGSSGGSGGGHSEYQSTLVASTSNQPDVAGFTKRVNAGGAMERTASQAGSGGGGAGSAGVSVASSAALGTAGAGGAGFESSITGVATYYAAGGAGGQSATDTASLGGSSIGGNGGSSTLAPTAGSANTGSGGGGAGGSSSGGAGGSGLVIVSVPADVGNPTIGVEPDDVTKSAGEAATFSVTASSPDGGTLSYQWQVSTNNGSTWASVSGGSGATTSSYTTPTLVSGDEGKQYRVVVTNTKSGASSSTTSTAATLTIGLDKINVNFDELNFDYSNVLHVVGTNGKSVGNKVLFLNVTTKNGVQVDALVTTETLTSAVIKNYEAGANAGGSNSYFQTDVDINATNGFAQFKFDFYKHGVTGSAGNPCTVANPSCTGATKVVIQNVNVSAIDIDANQWNDFTLAESYTLAGNTKLKECEIPNTGTCTKRLAPTTFPANMRFQGDTSARSNDPVDMAIVTYAEIETFRIKFGRSTQGSPNYYGVAFKALDWGDTTPQTKGGTDYTISYNVNSATSGSQTGTHVGAAGSSFTVLSAGTAVKSGYTFAGWATSSSATTADYAASSKVTMPGSNLTLYAVWTPIKYTLTYNVNGGSGAPAAGSFETGTNNVTLSSTVPTRTGYVFGGWDTVVNSGTGNTNYDSGDSYSMPSSNTTLYAKWTIANGTLSYNGNSGTTTQASVTAAGNTTTTVASGSNTNRTGYDFAGWNSKADGTGTSYAVGSTFTLKANETTTVYAQWTLSKYNLTFNVNGGVGTPQTKSYVQGATTTMPVSNPTRDGYTFGGWNSLADGTGTNYTGSFLMPGNALTLYAKWTPITYNVTYNNNLATYSGASGSVTDANTYTAAQSVTVAAATGLTNVTGGVTYRFVGWNTAANGTGTDYVAGATFAMPAANTTLYAMWLDASVEIAYNANGGTGAPANDNAVINTRYDIRTDEPIRPGYTFGGWLISDGSPTGTYKVGGTEFFSPDSNFETLVAQWTAINYTIEYDTDGGSTAPADMTNKNIGDIITINSTPPTKSGYTFLGWKDAAGNIYPAGGTFILGAGNVTLTAQWQGTPYTLTYDANSGTGAPSAETRNYNESANLSTVEPTRTGYTFQGWNTLVNGNGTPTDSGDPFQMPSADTTLFAQWTVNNFLLAYNTQGGSTPPSGGSTNFDATVTVNATPPTKTGHTFAGWNTVVGGTGTTYLPSGTFKMPNENVTLYAQWTKTAYTLYYNTNGGQGVFSSQPVKYGESVTVDSTTPTKTGYTFSGWNTAADGTSGNDFNPMSIFTLNAESNVTLYAKWTPISYSLAYNANTGAGAPTGGSYNFGATVTTADKGSMNLTDYRFIGWNTRADGSGITYIEGATFAMPAENVILYAQWISSLYQIAYNANGGSGGPEGAIANDSTTYNIDPIEPVRPGYTFSGWKLADGTPTANALKVDAAPLASSFVVSGDELLVAQWTIKTITVTYDLNGGSRDSALSLASGNYATNVTLAASSGITRANFQFVGWSSTPDGTGTTYVDGSSYKLPAEDVILYAKWAPVYYVIEYNPAGGSGEPADQFATPSSTVAIATQEPSKSGYEFDKWTEVSQGTDFTPGSTLTMPSSNVVLVANYSVRAASVPGSGSGGSVEAIKPTTPVNKPKELNLTVYFQGDSSVLIPRTKLALQKIAKLAKSYGRANNITIYGRVKLTNDKSYDMKLSKARAANVAAYLKKFGVTGSFKVYAKGIAPENNFRARRVEVKLWWAK